MLWRKCSSNEERLNDKHFVTIYISNWLNIFTNMLILQALAVGVLQRNVTVLLSWVIDYFIS